jgi:S-adenosylmethionine-dependent methyltransferase
MEGVVGAGAYFDKVAPIYDSSSEKEPLGKYLHALKWHVMREALPQEPDSDILELGGGTGYWTIPLAKLGHRVTMVDASRGMLSVAEQKVEAEGLAHLVQLRHGDMAELDDLPSDQFALVLATGGSLNYCPHYRRAVRQMVRLCSPGGYVFLDPTSRFAYLPDLLREGDLKAVYELVGAGTFYEEYQGHRVQRHEFEIDELLALLREEGLRVCKVLGNSILVEVIGRKNTLRMLEEMGVDRLIELEEHLSRNESLLSRALHFDVLCEAT